jgi:hypothetical protein
MLPPGTPTPQEFLDAAADAAEKKEQMQKNLTALMKTPEFSSKSDLYTATTRTTSPDNAPVQDESEISKLLESTEYSTKGTREKPSVLKFPTEIGMNQVPHAVQFKIFWRWQKDMQVDKNKKIEEETKIQLLKSQLGKATQSASAVNYGNFLSEFELPGENLSRKFTTSSAILDTEETQNLQSQIISSQTVVDSLSNRIATAAGGQNLSQNERAQKLSSSDVQLATTAGNAALGPVQFNPSTAAVAAVASISLAQVTVAQYDQMTSIYLPMCTSINNEDIFSYNDASFKLVSGTIEAVSGSGAGFVDAVKQAAGAAIGYATDKVGIGAERQLLMGTVINPRLEKMFKQKEFRTFSFAWELYARSDIETRMIQDIIETFRYHAHPAIQDQAFGDGQSNAEIMLRVPAEFEIRFLSTNPNSKGFIENEYIPKIARCVATNIQVNYTPQSLFSTFRDNAPIGVNLTIQFSEIGLLTREAVEQGF